MTDPIADMFVRIKNAHAVRKDTVVIPFSKVKQEIAEVLKKEGFISDFDKKGRGVNKRININLLYKDNIPAIRDFRRYSKPSQRQYIGYKKLFPVRSGYGVSIISTSKGIMSNKSARENKVGGELMVEVW